MKKKNLKDIRFRKKDIEILHYISSQGLVSISEIYTRFYKSKKDSNCHYRRLNRFKNHGLITSFISPVDSLLEYAMTVKGKTVLQRYGHSVDFSVFKHDAAMEKYQHDFLVNSVKNIILQSSLIDRFIPKYCIAATLYKCPYKRKKYKGRDKTPDGLFHLHLNGKPQTVALELELGLKAKRKYEHIFAEHLLSKHWGTIFYVVKDEKMRDKLMTSIQEVKCKNVLVKVQKKVNTFYFVLLDDVLEKKLNATFMNEKIDFSLKGLEKLAS